MSDRDRKPPFRRGGGKPFEKGRKFARPPGRRDRDSSPDGPVILYGWHTVSAALANPERQIRKLFLTAVQEILLNGKDPKTTMQEAQTRAQDLMPK